MKPKLFPLADGRTPERIPCRENGLHSGSPAHVHAAVIVTKPHAPGYAGGKRSELLAYGLPDRLQRFEAMRLLYGMDPETFRCAVINCGENRYLSVLLRERRGGICSPQLVGPVHNDGAGVWVFRSGNRRPAGRKQLMLAHDTQNPVLPCPYIFMPQARPDLSVTLAVKNAFFDDLSDLADQFLV
jgi:hypothetical protein